MGNCHPALFLSGEKTWMGWTEAHPLGEPGPDRPTQSDWCVLSIVVDLDNPFFIYFACKKRVNV